ncbi:NCS1 nucleoside transporter [Macrophomina phaseolina]|uniref:NCS1 nucleoside transporter n=1 Tax=Macrophomina phaseolina TaxID=35725 RepID=A0ABQ8GTN2_9PEZI|nr:NCS1 nucleoside transporter [Macrophomina phaseolina]
MPTFPNLLHVLRGPRDPSTTTACLQRDTRPLPPSRRTYGPWSFVLLWVVTSSFNVGGWTTGSALIALGLNVWQAMLTVIIAHTFVGFVCLVGRAPGAKQHIVFPFAQRAVWGVRGAYWPLLNREFLSFVWTATNTWYGGQCVRALLCCIWPSFAGLDAEFAGGTMVMSEFVGYLVFLVLCLPLIWVSLEKYKKPFLVASARVVPTVFVLLIWSMTKASGGGVESAAAVGSSRVGWMIIAGITANIGGIAAHMFSQSDYTLYARKPGDQVLAQLIMVPLGTIIVSFIGIVCTSCAAQMYPDTPNLLWQPYALLDPARTREGTSSARVGVAFASIVFIFSQFGMTVASNAVVAGIDLAALAPQYFSIRRSGYFTVKLSLIMQPRQLLNSASKFLTVVGEYSVFLGPFMGVIFAEYYLVRRQNLKLTDLFEISEQSIYWFWRGVNCRCLIAWAVGTWPALRGYAKHVRYSGNVWAEWTHLWYLVA